MVPSADAFAITPWMIDLVLAGIAAEAVLISALLVRAGRTDWLAPLLWFLASGALLMLALRLALSGLTGPILTLPLLTSLITHIMVIVSASQHKKKPGPGAGPGRKG